MNYTNEELVNGFKNLENLELQQKQLRREADEAIRRLEVMGDLIRVVKQVAIVVDGVPLSAMRQSGRFSYFASLDSDRSVHIYRVCTRDGKWRIRFKKHCKYGQKELYYPADITYVKAIAMAKTWSAKGELPPEAEAENRAWI